MSMTPKTTTIELPARFAQDHYDRELPMGQIIEMGSRVWWTRVTREDLEELLSDADYYSDCAGKGWADPRNNFGLQTSARATVIKVRKALSTFEESAT